jgi:Tol biopolymer transport system component
MAPNGDVFHSQWVNEPKYSKLGPSPVGIAKLDGSDMRFLPNPADAMLWGTSLTRDGQWLFVSTGAGFGVPDDTVDIWKIHTRTGEAVNLTKDMDDNSAFPDVSADGSVVVFRRMVMKPVEGRSDRGAPTIFAMDGDGHHVRQLSDSPSRDTMPAVSPDGKWVAYATGRTYTGYRILVQPIEEGGEGKGALIDPVEGYLDLDPRFSPDGQWIVFASSRGGKSDEWLNSAGNRQPYGELWAIPFDKGRTTGPAVRLTYDKWENSLGYWTRLASGR